VRSPREQAVSFAIARARIVDGFVACVRSGAPHQLDVRRGLTLQRLLAAAAQQLSAA
jgi:hypothetical protein